MPYRKPAGLSHAANRKRVAYLQETGQGGYVPAGPVQERIRHLNRDLGIPLAVIAERADVNIRMIKAHAQGYFELGGRAQEACFKRTEVAVLGARFTEADRVMLNPTGTRRRLQALVASGFTYECIGSHVGWSINRACAVTTGTQARDFVRSEVARKVADAYGKLELAKPEDFGIGAIGITRARRRAVRLGYAPAHCWDPDTIDDPDAIPEWTGACGTAEGLRIHQREGIPACPPCLAVNLGPAAGALSLNPAKLKAAREARGLSHQDVGDLLGVHNSTVHYWETGRSAPRSRNIVDRYLAILDLNPEDAA